MSPKTKENRPQSVSEAGFGAVGESRTHTPQRALPPQSSVSTISPLPHGLGLQIYCEFLKTQIFCGKLQKKKGAR